MTGDARQQAILRLLGERDEVSAQELAQRFGVNIVTIRRDLAAMEAAGRLRRTHGGAMLTSAGSVRFEFARRQGNAAAKAAIAQAAVALIKPGMCISLDTGTTTLEVAHRLPRLAGLTVLTSSLAIAAELHPREDIQLVLLGGLARKGSPDLAGELTEDNLRRFRVNLAFIGADAATPDGLFTTDANVARVSAAMIASARSVVLVADSSKFDSSAFVRFAEWREIDVVVTDSGLTPAQRRRLRRSAANVTVIHAERAL